MSRIATFMSGSRARRGMAGLAPLVLALCWSSHADAARPTLVVLPASGRGVSARIIQRARELFVESLGRRDRFHVTDYDRPPTAERAGSEEAVMTARLTGAMMAVAFDLSHEGADTIFDVHCWDADDRREPLSRPREDCGRARPDSRFHRVAGDAADPRARRFTRGGRAERRPGSSRARSASRARSPSARA